MFQSKPLDSEVYVRDEHDIYIVSIICIIYLFNLYRSFYVWGRFKIVRFTTTLCLLTVCLVLFVCTIRNIYEKHIG